MKLKLLKFYTTENCCSNSTASSEGRSSKNKSEKTGVFNSATDDDL